MVADGIIRSFPTSTGPSMSPTLLAPFRSLLRKLTASRSPRLSKIKSRRRRNFLSLESLEQRSLMAGDISGVVFNDLNSNGVNDKTDPGLWAGPSSSIPIAMAIYPQVNRIPFPTRKESTPSSDCPQAMSRFTKFRNLPSNLALD